MTTYDAVVLAWADLLRSGGTTSWSEFWPGAAAADDRPGPVPGAAQLELVRRLAEQWQGPGFDKLADRVLYREPPGRGLASRLPLAHPAAPTGFGAPPIDPAAVPTGELVRVGTGVLADLVLARPQFEAPADGRSSGTRAPSTVRRRGWGPFRKAVIVVPTLEQSLTEVWARRALHGGAMPWRRFVNTLVGHDALPRPADAAVIAARAASRIGATRVHVYVGDAGQPGPTRSPVDTDLLRRLNPVLAVRVPEHRLSSVRAAAATMLGADVEGGIAPLAVPKQHESWVRRRAARLAESLAAGGYSVHGDLDALVAEVNAPRGPGVAAVLDRLMEVVVRTVQEEQP